MAGKTPGTTRKSTAKKTSAKKDTTVTPIDQNSAQNQHLSQNGNSASVEEQPSRLAEASSRSMSPELVERIRARAYELFEQRGRLEGYDQQDWAQAEAEVLAKFHREKSA